MGTQFHCICACKLMDVVCSIRRLTADTLKWLMSCTLLSVRLEKKLKSAIRFSTPSRLRKR